MSKRREFIVRGRVTFDGVSFFVMAKDSAFCGLDIRSFIHAGQ